MKASDLKELTVAELKGLAKKKKIKLSAGKKDDIIKELAKALKTPAKKKAATKKKTAPKKKTATK
ncbi:MAG: hypothetical protein KAR83_02405, partial [Thermodesulfovibrionales bacterium]|nr:hypothetical protein [Thermodesulfovibrionales bacterium]